MSEWSLSLWFEPKNTATVDRVLASNRNKNNPHLAINASHALGYYASGSFVSAGGALYVGTMYHVGVDWDDTGAAKIYLSGNLLATVTDFPTYAVNEIGNFRGHGLYPSDSLYPSDTLYPLSEGGSLARPCLGVIDEPAIWNRRLTAGEWADLAQGAKLSKVYTSADYYLGSANDDNLISPMEKVTYYRPDWLKISNNDQQTTALPTAIASIVYDGEYKTLATAANAESIWTPTTADTQAYNYYVAVNNYRAYLFDSSVNGFLLTANMDVVSSVNGDTLDALLAAIITTSNELSIAISAADATTKADDANTSAQSYADSLASALQDDIDGKITTWYQAAAPTTGMTVGDLWIDTDDGNNQYRYNGTEWVDIQDTAIASAYSLANSKRVTWATLALAQASAAIGDYFLDGGILYYCTVASSSITIANSTRKTPKSWGNLATAPSSGVIANDTYYNTASLTWYVYSGSAWTVDGTAQTTVVASYTPSYRGIGILASATNATYPGATVDTSGTITVGSSITAITKDWMINYSSANVDIGLYYWSGSAWTLSTDVKYMDSCTTDLLNLNTAGIAISGYTVFINAIIKNLMIQTLKILTGGSIYGGERFDSSGKEIDYTKNGVYIGADGSIKANLQSMFNNNIFIGTDAGLAMQSSLSTNSNNTFVGTAAGKSSQNGYNDTYLGHYAGYADKGSANTFIGAFASKNRTTGARNTSVGYSVDNYGTTGTDNVMLGYLVGGSTSSGLETGSRNIGIGSGVKFDADTNDSICMGYNRTAETNELVIGSWLRGMGFSQYKTQDDVYTWLKDFVVSTGDVISCLGRSPTGDSDFCIIERTSSTTIVAKNVALSIVHTFISGSTTAIGSAISILLQPIAYWTGA